MKMRRFIVFMLAAVSVLAMVSAASAANWRRVYSDRDIIVHVDTSSIRNHGDYFEVRERTIFNSYQSKAEIGIMAAFAVVASGNSGRDAEVTHAITIKQYKKNESMCKIFDGVLLNRKGETVCPMNETKWDKCSKEEEAVRRAVKAMKGWK
ncbi:MAG: hypothetical protein Q4E34_04260 [Synergistaceae bacterium]|nr:hypothetical protein [Synergistaceae bacterium]